MIISELPDADFTEVLKQIFEFLPEKVKANQKYPQSCGRLTNFLKLRIENILESAGYLPDEVKSIAGASQNFQLKSLGNFEAKLKSLKAAKNKGDFTAVSAVFKRINNILTQAKKQNIALSDNINQTLFAEEAEQTLFNVYQKTKSETETFISNKEYNKVFDKVLEIKPAIDNFFEKVMVMSENEEVKKNRITLLNSVQNIFSNFIDFSVLQ